MRPREADMSARPRHFVAGLCSHDWRLTPSTSPSRACPTTVIDGQSPSGVGVTTEVYPAKAGDLRRLRLNTRRKLALTFSLRAIAPVQSPIAGGPTEQPDFVD